MHKSQKSTIQMTNKIFQKNVPMYKLLGRMYMNMKRKYLTGVGALKEEEDEQMNRRLQEK